MAESVFMGLLALLLAPFLGVLLLPTVARVFADLLLRHAEGMAALYPALKFAGREYVDGRQRTSAGTLDMNLYFVDGVSKTAKEAGETRDEFYKRLQNPLPDPDQL